MAFQLKLKESVSDGVRRVAKRELATALQHLRSHGKEDEAVHEVRKCCKKVRAALRLVRDELGDTAYRRENFAFRDAARPLTEVRDAAMLVETFDQLIKDSADEIETHAFDEVREALLRNQRDVSERVLKKECAFAKVAEAIEQGLARLPDWTIDQDGWQALGGGLSRVYRAGHRALATAAAEPTVENLHEWRKQAKYLWHQLQLIEPAWIADEKELGEQVHTLTGLVGDDHDLAVLRRLLIADPLGHGGQRVLKSLIALIDRRRRALQEKALVLGRQVYRDPPKVFTRRFDGHWKTWSSQADGAKPGARSQRAPGRPEPHVSIGGTPGNQTPRATRARKRAACP
jgi:CHAD domain-containing protein